MQCTFITKTFHLLTLIFFANCGQIKIIDGPFSLLNAGIQSHNPTQAEVKLVAKVRPQNLSGPPHLFSLAGQCYTLEKTTYKYEFCPFHNVTQRESSYRWNSFHGVLGVWKEWKIANRTFECMVMTDGEDCLGMLKREVEVHFTCGNEHKFKDIEEPRTCKYNLTFQTPLACAVDAFMVYPVLSDTGRAQWDEIEDAFEGEELTVQGYNKERKKLFIKEGFIVHEESQKNEESTTVAALSNSNSHQDEDGHKKFTRSQCIENYGKLLEEVKQLRSQLNSTNISKENKNATLSNSEEIDITRHENERKEDQEPKADALIYAVKEQKNKLNEVKAKERLRKQDPVFLNSKKTNKFIESISAMHVSKNKGSKKLKGKMGDDGYIKERVDSTKKKTEGHWLGRSIDAAKRKLGLENDVKRYENAQVVKTRDLSHLYH